MFGCESLSLFPTVAGGSLSDDSWARNDLCVHRISLGIISLTFLPVMFGSILGLWVVQPLGSEGYSF